MNRNVYKLILEDEIIDGLDPETAVSLAANYAYEINENPLIFPHPNCFNFYVPHGDSMRTVAVVRPTKTARIKKK